MCQISGTVFLLAKFLHEFALEPILPPLRARLNKVERALKFQCCLTKHVFRMSKQYLANVARKINVKVGGSNTVLMDALSKRMPLVRHTIIIFGADVTHPHPGEDSSPSIAAVVASQDWPEVTKYAWLVLSEGQKPQRIIFCRYTIQKFTCILGWSKRRAILSSVAFMSLIKKGTSRPAHYHALWDDNKVTTDQLQTLTNNLCYIYARCAISIVLHGT
ncbi:unnamed protein product [Musa hybrid cultivar]